MDTPKPWCAVVPGLGNRINQIIVLVLDAVLQKSFSESFAEGLMVCLVLRGFSKGCEVGGFCP